MKPLVLGSSSPRRVEILRFFSIPFEQYAPSYDELALPYLGDAILYAKQLAEGKALAIPMEDRIILTADTVVTKEGKIFGKPTSHEERMEMLQELNGEWHTVYTALTIRLGDFLFTDHAQTNILFHQATLAQLERYHRAFNGLDKAGGYGIQMGGSVIIKRIEGCFYNVMGLPLTTLQRVLDQVGIDLWSYL